ILAEAAALYRAGERWHFDEAEEGLRKLETDTREEESTVQEAIARWWYGTAPALRVRSATTLDVADAALHLPHDRVDHRVRVEIGHAMRRLGFDVRRRSAGSAARARAYVPSAELLAAPQETSASRARHLALVEAARPAQPEKREP